MREFPLDFMRGLGEALAIEPFWMALVLVVTVIVVMAMMAGGILLRLRVRANISGGPILLGSALVVLGLCLLWTITDGILWWRDAPLLSEQLLRWMAPDALESIADLRSAVGLPGDSGALRFPPSVSMIAGLILAGILFLAMAAIAASILAERISLEFKPEDILQKERQDRERARAKKRAEREKTGPGGGPGP